MTPSTANQRVKLLGKLGLLKYSTDDTFAITIKNKLTLGESYGKNQTQTAL